MNIEIAGEQYTVEYVESSSQITPHVQRDRPEWLIFDSETDSKHGAIHTKKDRPFLWAVCFGKRVWVFPSTPKNLKEFENWKPHVGRFTAHNTVFDLNMLANGTGDDNLPLRLGNVADTMGMLRLVFEARSPREGGDKLALKTVSAKYVDPKADRFEKDVKHWLKQKAAQDRKILIALLKQHGWTMKRFEAVLNKGAEPIPEEVMDTFREWRNAYPEPTYQDVPMDIMLPYVAVDVILTQCLVQKSLPVIQHRDQLKVMEDEFALIPVIYSMSRIGIQVDRQYLMDSRERLDAYIEQQYEALYEITGRDDFSVNQHKVIQEIYTEILDEIPESVDKKFMGKMRDNGDPAAPVIIRLRTLDKWRSTYIDRILEGSEFDGRFYPSLDQFNPISGRFSGNLQQQPKKPIKHHETGEEIFHPRRAFVADSDDGFSFFLLDFSQVELRFQAHYTLPFGGDMNLCRAYMPYKCTHYKTGGLYNPFTEEGKARWDERQPTGESAWLLEGGAPWHPTDVHSASTQKALTLMGIDWQSLSEKEFQAWRGTGKGVNFAKNYGVGIKGAAAQFGLPLETAKALCEGYNEAFPLVVVYQRNVEKALHKRGYVTNLYGRRYYITDSFRFYKAANYLVQGSCASDLKQKMLKIFHFLKGKKSKMLTCIHDEIIYRIHESEHDLIPQLKSIMEDTPIVNVPIVAEVDWTRTSWADKEKWEGEQTWKSENVQEETLTIATH